MEGNICNFCDNIASYSYGGDIKEFVNLKSNKLKVCIFTNGFNNNDDGYGYYFCNECVKKLSYECTLTSIFKRNPELKTVKKVSNWMNCTKCNKLDRLLHDIKLDPDCNQGLCEDCIVKENYTENFNEILCCNKHNCKEMKENNEFTKCKEEYCKGRLIEMNCNCKICIQCNKFIIYNGIITNKEDIYFKNDKYPDENKWISKRDNYNKPIIKHTCKICNYSFGDETPNYERIYFDLKNLINDKKVIHEIFCDEKHTYSS